MSAAETASVRIEKAAEVWTVILSRPQARNAVDNAAARLLYEAFLAFDADDSAKVAVFWGDGGAFCAGADLKAVANTQVEQARPSGPVTAHSRGPMGPSRLLLTKPVIAAIAGPAVAGGLELALWCDLRVAEEDAVLGVYCRRWGVPLIDGGTIRLPRLIGHARAMDLILTGRGVGAEEALTMGLVNRVVPKGAARTEAEKLAREIARFPQMCMRADRASAYAQWDLDYETALAHEFDGGRAVIASGQTQAGAARFASGKGRGGDFNDI